MKAKLLYVVIRTLCRLLGWTVAKNKNELRLQSLTRRWH